MANKIIEWVKFVGIIILVMVACFYAFDKFVVWKYHLQEAADPCQFCIKMNPQVPLARCFNEQMRYVMDNPTYPKIDSSINFSNLPTIAG